jgi:simple sugar transport system permease protein
MIKLTPRINRSPWLAVLSPAISVIATVIISALIFTALGYDAGATLYELFISPLARLDRITSLAVKACPLIMIALGLIFCYRANVWNIGAEGQFIIGAVAAGILALSFPEATSPVLLPMMMLTGMLAGAAWAAIAAVGKVFFKTNEILVTWMLSYVAALFVDVMVRGPLRDPAAFGFPLSPVYPDAGLIGRIDIPGLGYVGQLHYGVLIAFALVPPAWWLLNRTLPGYQVRVIGSAPRAGRFAGFSQARVTFGVLLLSGAAAGLAGMIEVSANLGQLQHNISFGYGFTAIIVAYLARLNPVAVIFAGLLIAMAEVGGDIAQIALGIPKVVTGIFKGVLLFFILAGETLHQYRIEIRLPGVLRQRASS